MWRGCMGTTLPSFVSPLLLHTACKQQQKNGGVGSRASPTHFCLWVGLARLECRVASFLDCRAHARESGNEAKCSGHDVQQQGFSGEEDGSLWAWEVSVPAGARDRVSRHSQTRLKSVYRYFNIHCRSGGGLLCWHIICQCLNNALM